MMRAPRLAAWCCIVLGVAAIGCRREGLARYELSGAVTFNGQSVTGGQVIFTPDSSQGNSGPGCVALIKNGRYKTFADKGSVGGAHRVTVIGYNEIPGTVPESQVQALFPPTELQLDLPTASGTLDIEVPSS